MRLPCEVLLTDLRREGFTCEEIRIYFPQAYDSNKRQDIYLIPPAVTPIVSLEEAMSDE